MTARWYAGLEGALGYRFRNRAYPEEALTHSTYANENPGSGPDNQRLEFLGDAVLGLLASRLLYEQLQEPEGELSRRRARVVRLEALAALARELDLGAYLRFGAGQAKEAGSRAERTLADAYEALAGAVFLDGGFAAVERCFGPRLAAAAARATRSTDFKTELQELCHARHLPPPRYEIAGVGGPDHARVYSIEVHIGAEVRGRGEGSSKKAAEQIAAEAALAALEQR